MTFTYEQLEKEKIKTELKKSFSKDSMNILESLPKDLFESKGLKIRDHKETYNIGNDHKSFRDAFLKALQDSESANDDKKVGHLLNVMNKKNLADPFLHKVKEMGKQSDNDYHTSSEKNETVLLQRAMKYSDHSMSNWETDRSARSKKHDKEMPFQQVNSTARVEVERRKHSSESRSHEHQDKKTRKRRHRSSSSSSSSDDEKANAEALEKKKNILIKVWSLMEQKKKLDSKRDEVLRRSGGDKDVLLKENDLLSSEIDKQIFLMNQKVQAINEKLGLDHAKEQVQHLNTAHQKDRKKKVSSSSNNKKVLENKYVAKKLEKPVKPLNRNEKVSDYTDEKLKSSDKKQNTQRRSKDDLENSQARPPDFEKAKSNLKLNSTSLKKTEKSSTMEIKPTIRYQDQGMHWCKHCNIFLDSVENYVEHLQCLEHISVSQDLAIDKLLKPPTTKKEKSESFAPVVVIPFQGVEFLSSAVCFYCSLCKSFVLKANETTNHFESEQHSANYKEHLVKNPMYEASYVKRKMAAYAEFSVEKERYWQKNFNVSKDSKLIKMNECEKQDDFMINIKECEEQVNSVIKIEPEKKRDSFIKREPCKEQDDLTKIEPPNDHNSLMTRYIIDEKVQTNDEMFEKNRNPTKENSTSIRVASRSSAVQALTNIADYVLEWDHVAKVSQKENDQNTTPKESKLENLKNKIFKQPTTDEIQVEKSAIERETVDVKVTESSESRFQIKQVSNVLIGKMPFLKKSSNLKSVQSSKEKSEQRDKLISDNEKDIQERIAAAIRSGSFKNKIKFKSKRNEPSISVGENFELVTEPPTSIENVQQPSVDVVENTPEPTASSVHETVQVTEMETGYKSIFTDMNNVNKDSVKKSKKSKNRQRLTDDLISENIPMPTMTLEENEKIGHLKSAAEMYSQNHSNAQMQIHQTFFPNQNVSLRPNFPATYDNSPNQNVSLRPNFPATYDNSANMAPIRCPIPQTPFACRPMNDPNCRPMNDPNFRPMNGSNCRPMIGPNCGPRPMNNPNCIPMNNPNFRPSNGSNFRPINAPNFGPNNSPNFLSMNSPNCGPMNAPRPQDMFHRPRIMFNAPHPRNAPPFMNMRPQPMFDLTPRPPLPVNPFQNVEDSSVSEDLPPPPGTYFDDEVLAPPGADNSDDSDYEMIQSPSRKGSKLDESVESEVALEGLESDGSDYEMIQSPSRKGSKLDEFVESEIALDKLDSDYEMIQSPSRKGSKLDESVDSEVALEGLELLEFAETETNEIK